jgi:hypothetical protein
VEEQNNSRLKWMQQNPNTMKLGLIQTYQLNYNFPRKIKSVSHNAATISDKIDDYFFSLK